MSNTRHPQIRALLLAFTFLTRIPMPTITGYQAEDSSRALYYFPLVGACMGLLLCGITTVFASHPLLTAALVLTIWVLMTGGLHLDGLADSSDAWLGGLGDRDRTLKIMKDPRCGTAAILSINCLMLIKFSALVTFLQSNTLSSSTLMLLMVPLILGRCAPLVLALTTHYANPEGLAKPFIDHAQPFAILNALILTWLFTLLLCGFSAFMIIMFVNTLLFLVIRQLMIQRLGGYTGDTIGATIEITEASTLMTLALIS